MDDKNVILQLLKWNIAFFFLPNDLVQGCYAKYSFTNQKVLCTKTNMALIRLVSSALSSKLLNLGFLNPAPDLLMDNFCFQSQVIFTN